MGFGRGYQPRNDGGMKGSLRGKHCEVAMDGYQPRNNEVTKGYRPTPPVTMANLKIPKNIGTAGVTPRNSGNPVRTSVEPKKR